ncbi:MAG: hypothetical protein SFU86_20070 [Pirellulaceae bacterium]|nr:hypothetical protein [Pirellulaceae bacterium]
MPKFYVQSGNLRLVLSAANARGAAIWAAHRVLSRSLPFLCEEPADYLALGPLTQLGESILVSEQGFGGMDGEAFETLDIVTEWNHLLVAIDRLHRRLADAS